MGFYARFCVTVVRSQSLSFGIGFVNAQNSADISSYLDIFLWAISTDTRRGGKKLGSVIEIEKTPFRKGTLTASIPPAIRNHL